MRISLVIMAALIALTSGLYAVPTVKESLTTNKIYKGTSSVEVSLYGEQIDNGGSISVSFYDIGGASGIDMLMPTVSSGNITTANISWQIPGGTELTSETLTAATDITDFDSSIAVVTIYNLVATTVNVTGNIIVRW